MRCLTASPSHRIASTRVCSLLFAPATSQRAGAHPALASGRTQPAALPRRWFPCSSCRPQLGRSEPNGGLSHRDPQTRGVIHIPGAERTPDRAKGRSAGTVLQTVPWLAGCVLWPPTCLCWLAHRQASGPPAPAPFSVLALLADLPGRPRTVPTCRPSPGPAPPVSPAFPTPKAATGCASPLKRAVETKKTTDPTLLGRGTLPVR